MRLAVSLLAPLALLSGCYGPSTKLCPETGYLCREEDACKPAPVYCGEMPLIEKCIGLSEFDACSIEMLNDGVCVAGTCTACSPDLAGCQFDTWVQMSSPVTTTLNAVWMVSAERAYAGGESQQLLEYDGREWKISELWPDPSQLGGAIASIWASAASDVYVVTSGGELWHFDGITWADRTAMLPAGGDVITAVGGSSQTDVYVVGFGGTIAHYNGATWQLVSGPPGPGLNAVAVGTSMIAVGNSGYVYRRDSAGVLTSGQWMPSEIGNEVLYDVAVTSTDMIAVGRNVTGNTPTIAESTDGQTWQVPQLDGIFAVNLNTVWSNATTAYAATTNGQVFERGTDRIWRRTVQLGGEVKALAGAGSSVFAVGLGGAIWRRAPRS